MVYKGLSYNELIEMDTESFSELMTRIHETTTKTSPLTDAQQEMINRTKGKRE